MPDQCSDSITEEADEMLKFKHNNVIVKRLLLDRIVVIKRIMTGNETF